MSRALRTRLAGLHRLFISALFAMFTGLLVNAGTASTAAATTQVSSTPRHEFGWCAGNTTTGGWTCYQDPVEACKTLIANSPWPTRPFTYVEDTVFENSKRCYMDFYGSNLSPGSVVHLCNGTDHGSVDTDGTPLYFFPPNTCAREQFPTSNTCQRTAHPIDILSGAKLFEAEDFRSANRSLELTRYFNSLGWRDVQEEVIAPKGQVANWSLNSAFELQIPRFWNGRVSVLTPDGRGLTFQRNSDGSLSPYQPTTSVSDRPARPLPQPDYQLSFVGTWPSSLSTVTSASRTFSLKGPDDTVYTIVTRPDPARGNEYVYGRVTLIKTREGASQTLAYGADGRLNSITDDAGNTITFDWALVSGKAHAISVAHLPGGNTITYVYDAAGATGPAEPLRLIKVEFRDSSNTLVDSTSYSYGNSDYPYFVTDISDKNNVVRWSVTYDAE